MDGVPDWAGYLIGAKIGGGFSLLPKSDQRFRAVKNRYSRNHVGRKHRVVSPSLKRALLGRDKCCRGCFFTSLEEKVSSLAIGATLQLHS